MNVAMLDLRATTPYYDAGLCLALRDSAIAVRLYSSPPRLDPDLYERLGVPVATGVIGLVERLRISHQIGRRVLRAFQLVVNAVCTWLRLLLGRPDVVHLQWLSLPEFPLIEIALMRLMRRRGSRVVLTVHNVRPHEGGGRRLDAVYQTPDALLCHTRAAAQRLESEFAVEPSRIHIVHEGPIVGARSNPPREQSGPDTDPTVLFCGVMRPYKGAQVLLDAWSIIERLLPSARLVIAGGGHADELRLIAEGVARRSLRRVDLRLATITTDELDGLYAESDIAVLPYLEASGSEALIRAMTAGLSVVASSTGGLREWVRDRETGILVTPGDPQALSDALMILLQNATLRRTLGIAARAHVNTNLSWHSAARRTLSVYAP